jgi:hypothetical protein
MGDATHAQCTYTLNENGVHEYTIHDASRDSIDVWLQMMTVLVDGLNREETDAPVLMLIDNSQIAASAPLNYVMTSLQRWSKNTYRRRRAYVAVIMGNSAIIGVVDLLLRTFRLSDTVRLFRASEKDVAYTWLDKMKRSRF